MIAEYEEAGLCVVDIKSVKTQIWMLPEIETLINNPSSMNEVLNMAREVEDHVEIGQALFCVGKAN